MGECDKRQAGPDQSEFFVRQGQQQLVAHRLTFGARAFAGLDSLKLWGKHQGCTDLVNRMSGSFKLYIVRVCLVPEGFTHEVHQISSR